MKLQITALLPLLVFSQQGFAISALSPLDPSLQGITITSETVTIYARNYSLNTPLSPVVFADEMIVQNTAGTLDFYFKLRNVDQPRQLSLFSFPIDNSIQASAFYLDQGIIAPTSGGIDTVGNQNYVDYTFGINPPFTPVTLGPDGTDTLLLRTSAHTYTSGTLFAGLGIDNPEIQSDTALIPAPDSVPEPSALALLSVGAIGLSMKKRRGCLARMRRR
jgi:hypothetical protein